MVVVAPIAVVLTLFAVPGLVGGNMSAGPRFVAALGVAIFGLAFVVVSSRIVGLIGVSSNPTSGMALVTLLGVSVVFVAMGWTDMAARAAILTVGTVVCVAASKAGDISQDLKTGQLVGATPARQQLGQFIAAACACWAVAATVLVLNNAYKFGSPDLPAPQATLMRTVIDGVLAGALPWGLVGTGAMFSLCAMLAGLPGLSFAIGIYLPLGTLTPIFLGGILRRMVEARRVGPPPESDPGVLASSGMIAGEGLAGVTIAFIIGAQKYWPEAVWSMTLGGHSLRRPFVRAPGRPAGSHPRRGDRRRSGPSCCSAPGSPRWARPPRIQLPRSNGRPTDLRSWKTLRREWAQGPIDETRAWTSMSMNLLVLPGLGSFLARRRIAGAAQAMLAAVGGAMSVWWLILLTRQWTEDGYFPWDGGADFRIGIFGVLIFGVAWVWSLATSLAVVLAARSLK